MNKSKVLEMLKQSPGIQEVEEIQYDPELLVVSFFYDYDEDELEAARDYANTESGDEEENWYSDYYIPYITDLAADEVRDSIEEIVDELGLNAEYISYEPDKDDESCEFVAAFSDEGREFDIDEIMESIGI